MTEQPRLGQSLRAARQRRGLTLHNLVDWTAAAISTPMVVHAPDDAIAE